MQELTENGVEFCESSNELIEEDTISSLYQKLDFCPGSKPVNKIYLFSGKPTFIKKSPQGSPYDLYCFDWVERAGRYPLLLYWNTPDKFLVKFHHMRLIFEDRNYGRFYCYFNLFYSAIHWNTRNKLHSQNGRRLILSFLAKDTGQEIEEVIIPGVWLTHTNTWQHTRTVRVGITKIWEYCKGFRLRVGEFEMCE
jgi:phage FluMu protein Com